ncbi:MAG TPA: hemerythrin domain-containing protein [Spirochaetia bacterium]|nr:hemerythrin domain-containing protein [Spirochaetia bacterium]
MQKLRVTNGVYWVEIPEADLYILCGCPADAVKHLMKMGLIAERERNGVVAQTGPNAILLSDTTIQKGSFSNLAEFPVLQMLYLQGMILPHHPNNTGRKPMLIGLEDQVRTQSGYIYRGTYGLLSEEEIREAGVPGPLARDMVRIKRWFAFDNIRRTEELMELKVVDSPAVELRGGAFIRRRGFNRYEFLYGGESVTVDLNLGDTEEYLPTYLLGSQTLRREYFSVVHIGEGDGWDVTRPCMASMVCFQGRIYLVDAGPNIVHSLNALGVSINEISGIFHTHGHDDHFAGLTSLVSTDHRIAYYAAPAVRASIVKKYASLTGRNEATFYQYFEPHDLLLDQWNSVEGLEVMPVLSPHPVETTVFFFRALWEKGYRTYAHLADISSFEVLRKMVVEDPGKNGITQEAYDSFTQKALTPVNIKKIDIGGGLIHGRAEDFSADASGKVYLSHTSAPLTDAQKEIGSCAAFGQQDVLISMHADSLLKDGLRVLRGYFPGASEDDVAMLGNCPVVRIPPETIVQRADTPAHDVYFLLSGMLELIDSKTGLHNRNSAGSLIGELECFGTGTTSRTCRALSNVTALRIPCEIYLEFLRRAGVESALREVRDRRRILQGSWLFGEMVSFPLQARIARAMERRFLKEDDVLAPQGRAEILLLDDGLMSVFLGATPIENLTPGGFFGEETIMRGAKDLPEDWRARFTRPSMRGRGSTGSHHLFEARALLPSTLYAIPAEAIEDIPVVQWKLMETYERRLKSRRAEVHFLWHESYVLGVPDLDEQHRELFALIESLAAIAEGRSNGDGMNGTMGKLVTLARSHLQYEETLSAASPAKGYDVVIREHSDFVKKVEGLLKYLDKAPVDALPATVEFLKDWVIDHTLVEHRRFRLAAKS